MGVRPRALGVGVRVSARYEGLGTPAGREKQHDQHYLRKAGHEGLKHALAVVPEPPTCVLTLGPSGAMVAGGSAGAPFRRAEALYSCPE